MAGTPISNTVASGIQPAPGYMVDPSNPNNGVVKIGSINTAAPQNIGSTTGVTAYGGIPTAQPNGTLASSPAPTQGLISLNKATPSPYVPGSIGPGNVPSQSAPAANNPPSASAGMLNSVGYGGYFTDAQGNYYDNTGQRVAAPTQPTPTSTNLTSTSGTQGLITPPNNSTAIANQATTAQTNPINDPNNPLVQNLKSAQDALAKYQQQQSKTFGQMETGDEALPIVLGREGALQKQQSGYLSSLQQAVSTAQNALNTAVSAYSAQTGAQNNVSTQTSPGVQNITPPAGGVTTNALSGQQYSNPALGPVGSQQFYSPQPNGTPGQPGTAGQATPYTIKSGDTFSSIAAATGQSVQALEAANPGVVPTNMKVGSSINIPAAQGSPFTAGVVAGQQAAGEQIAQQQVALSQARSIQSKIAAEIQSNPSLNSNPTALGNAISQWALNKQLPSGPYVNFLNDLQEYANTIAPVLGVGGGTTDLKTTIANQMVPTLASGGTIQSALDNLDTLAVGKINKGIEGAKNAGNPSTPQAPTNTGYTSSDIKYSW